MDVADYKRRITNEQQTHRKFADQNAVEGEVRRFSPKVAAFDYAMKVYSPFLRARMPHLDVFGLVKSAAESSPTPLRLISLGCGTGDVEFRLAAFTPGRLQVELVDLDDGLLRRAREAAARDHLPVTTHVEDVNKFDFERGAYDFIVCRSSLHHFVELERVLDQISAGLAPDGRFLVVGEWIGRRGLQLYPEQERIGQAIFSRLPARYRRDAYNGEVRNVLPSIDHSLNSFEALRSEEILPLLLDRLRPVEYVTLDALVTPLLDFRFGPNYDISREEDRKFIEEIVSLDIECLTSGVLKPTALFGLFARR